MDLDLLVRRQAVTEWRDRFVLLSYTLINGAAKGARAGFEQHLRDAGLLDSIWDRPSFTYERIDAAMRATLAGGIRGLLASAAEELVDIDASYKPLANALASSAEGIILPMLEASPAGSGQETPGELQPVPAETAEGVLSRVSTYISEMTVVRSAREWGDWASENVVYAAGAASRTVQDRTGLFNLLRATATDRIATAWMGKPGVGGSVAAQLVELIDDAGQGARSAAL